MATTPTSLNVQRLATGAFCNIVHNGEKFVPEIVAQGQVRLQQFQDRILPEAAALAKQEADTFTTSQHCQDMVNGFNHFLQTAATVGYDTKKGTAIIGNWFEKYGIQNLTHVQNYLTWERNEGAKTLLQDIQTLAKVQLASENIHPPAPDAPAELGAAYVTQLEAKKTELLKTPPAPLFKPTKEGYQALLQELLAKPGHEEMKNYIRYGTTSADETGTIQKLSELLQENTDIREKTIQHTLQTLFGRETEILEPKLARTFNHFANSIHNSLKTHSKNRIQDLEKARTFTRMQTELTQLRQAFKQHIGEQGSRIITAAPPPLNPNFAFSNNLKERLITEQQLQLNSPLNLPKGTSLAYTNLSGVNLTNAQLPAVNLTGATLDGSVLNYVQLPEAQLNGASLQNTEINSTNFEKAQLSGVNLTNATGQAPNFTQARLADAKLSQANLPEATLHQANLKGVDASFANLPQAILTSAELAHGTFLGANLTGAQLNNLSSYATRNTNFAGANLTKANLSKSHFVGDSYYHQTDELLQQQLRLKQGETTFASATLEGANLTNTKLGASGPRDKETTHAPITYFGDANGITNLTPEQREALEAHGIDINQAASFKNAILEGAEISHVNLEGANLTNANLTNATIRDSNLRHANFADTNLSDTRLMFNDASYSLLPNAHFNEKTDLRKNNFTGAEFNTEGVAKKDLSKTLNYYYVLDDGNNSLTNNRTVILPEDPKKIAQREAEAAEQAKNSSLFGLGRFFKNK